MLTTQSLNYRNDTMNVTKVKTEELKHTFSVKIPAQEFKDKLNKKIKETAAKANLPGFRPGKAPTQLIEARYGQEIQHEILEKIVENTLETTYEKEKIRPVAQPNITESNFSEKISPDNDLEFTFEVSVAPNITEINYNDIKIESPEITVSKEKINEFLEKLAMQNRTTEKAPKGHKAEKGDTTIINFEGFLGDTPFEGGKGEDFRLELGSNSFIPGFEDSLIGAKAGDKKDINVTFPKDYGAEDLAGKEARFSVEVKGIDIYAAAAVDDKLAESLGVENLGALKSRAEEVLGQNFTERSNEVKKIYLLNELDSRYDFPVPKILVEQEFQAIWQQIQHAKEHDHLEEEDKGKSDDELRSVYEALAHRRVKLALLVEEISRKNKFEVSDDELSSEAFRRVQQMPQHMQQNYMQQIQQDPQMLNKLRMPLLEGKVVEHILEQTKVSSKKVSEEEFENIEKTVFSGN